MKKQFKLTQDGVNELKAELGDLVSQRSEITERIKSARELGDLAENAEYASARQEQERTENRISEIEHILKNVEIITASKNGSKVRLGSRIKLKGEGGKTKEFQVVGTVEADPLEGKVSDESPIGKALIGKRVGDEVEIATPAETAIYVITSMS
ncbi:MAG TPA: transcription elongation factor GreA [Patescibacteria group bacterium]|nr:transcription elongation factor GreA [Patescibacteria group bacterium]